MTELGPIAELEKTKRTLGGEADKIAHEAAQLSRELGEARDLIEEQEEELGLPENMRPSEAWGKAA